MPLLRSHLFLLVLFSFGFPQPAAPSSSCPSPTSSYPGKSSSCNSTFRYPQLGVLSSPTKLPAKTGRLQLALMAPYSGGWVGAPSHEEAAMMALEAINNDASVLPTTELRFVRFDSQCSPVSGTTGFLRQLGALGENGPPAQAEEHGIFGGISGMIGPLCSGACEATARLAKLYNIAQISPTASLTSLSDKREFPYFMRTCTTASSVVREPTTPRLPRARATIRVPRARAVPHPPSHHPPSYKLYIHIQLEQHEPA